MAFCLSPSAHRVFAQELQSGLKQKVSTVEQLIDQKAVGVAQAKDRAESLQKEAKELLLQAADKLQLLKGNHPPQ